MSDNLWAGSTSTLTYAPATSAGAAYETEPTLDSFTLTDDANAPVTLAATPTWNSTLKAWVVNVSGTECPTTADGKKWTATWVWTDAAGVETTHRDLLVCTVLTGNVAVLCTRQQVRDRIGLKSTDTSRDARVDTLIAAVSTVARNRYKREFTPQVTATRTLKVTGRFVDLAPYDLRDVTTATLNPENADEATVLTAGVDYVLGPVGGDPLTGTYTYLLLADTVSLYSTLWRTFGYLQLEVAGAWGCFGSVDDVPADLNEAAIECVCAWLNKNSSDTASLDGSPRESAPAVTTWDIPFSAHRKFSLYANQSVGVL